MIWVWFALIPAFVYALLILHYLYHWSKVKIPVVPEDYQPTEGISVLVVARNEAENISACLQSILDQNFPSDLLDIIVVDDHSTDQTAAEVQKTIDGPIRFFRLQDYPEYIQAPAYKKSGITLGTALVKSDRIVVTDADCTYPKDWLRTVSYVFAKDKPAFQAAPVLLSPATSWIGKMQEMEQLTLMVITGAGIQSGLHDMANGANMAFSKNAFKQINGYEGNFNYPSGDDMFLVEKMRNFFQDKISFVKSRQATVYTKAKESWPALFQQRLRWAKKNKGLQHQTISRIWLFVGLYHVLLIGVFLLAILHFSSWQPFIILLATKWLADFVLVASATAFFERRSLMKYFVPLQVMYTYYLLRLGIEMVLQKKDDWER